MFQPIKEAAILRTRQFTVRNGKVVRRPHKPASRRDKYPNCPKDLPETQHISLSMEGIEDDCSTKEERACSNGPIIRTVYSVGEWGMTTGTPACQQRNVEYDLTYYQAFKWGRNLFGR